MCGHSYGKGWLHLDHANAVPYICGSQRVDIQTAAVRVVTTWVAAMPVTAAQLVLTTAAEDHALVGSAGWAAALPLAASGLVSDPICCPPPSRLCGAHRQTQFRYFCYNYARAFQSVRSCLSKRTLFVIKPFVIY